MSLATPKVGFIGAGAMAEALLTGIVKAKLLAPKDLYASDISREKANSLKENLKVQVAEDNCDLVKKVDIVFLAVKPSIIEKVIREIASTVTNKQIIVSIAAGITTSSIEKGFSSSVPVVRVMPNTPCLVGAGASAIALGQFAKEEQGRYIGNLLEAVGEVVHIGEELLDSVTGLSGSGPAYVYVMLEAMTDGGVKMGLPRPLAQTLAAQTMLGAAKMVLTTGEHPAKLKDMVTTPGGTTICGLNALEKGNLRATLMAAVEAATNRAKEMAK